MYFFCKTTSSLVVMDKLTFGNVFPTQNVAEEGATQIGGQDACLVLQSHIAVNETTVTQSFDALPAAVGQLLIITCFFLPT